MRHENSRVQCDNLCAIALQTPKVVLGTGGDNARGAALQTGEAFRQMLVIRGGPDGIRSEVAEN